MPIVSPQATKKAKAIAYAVQYMKEEGTLNTGDQEPMQDLFFAADYKLKNDSPRGRLQISSSVLYQH